MPLTALTTTHLDPESPVPGASDHELLHDFDETAARALVAAAGADSGSTLLSAEIRHLGGALARPAVGGGALSDLPGGYSGLFIAMAPTSQLAAQGRADAAKAVAALRPWANGRRFFNFAEEAVELETIFEPGTLTRLQAVRDHYDPSGMFLANHSL